MAGVAFTPFTSVCPENQAETFHISCPDGTTPVNGMCGSLQAVVTSRCEPIPPGTGSFTPTKGYMTNIDHIKTSSFAPPLPPSLCPPGAPCDSSLYPNYGVILTAQSAPLQSVVYGTQISNREPTNPSFPQEFIGPNGANVDCTVDGTSCKFIGADFSSNVMNEYDTRIPYIVDTASSIPTNTGIFVKQNILNPPTFTSPPGYTKYYIGVLDANSSTILTPVQTANTVNTCADLCNAQGSICTGFNYRLSTRECQLLKGEPYLSTTELNAVSFVREVIPTKVTLTAYPTGTDLKHEGTLCSNANMCNADLTKLVGDGSVSSFSTADLESCAFCPVRSYDKTASVVTNEVGTFAVTPTTYQQHLLYDTQPGVSSPILTDGFYSVTPWLPDNASGDARFNGASVFGTQQIFYSKTELFNGLFTISNGKIYGTIQAVGLNEYQQDMYPKRNDNVIYDIVPVSYVDNGYVFRLLDGGILAPVCVPGVQQTNVSTGAVGYSCINVGVQNHYQVGSLCCSVGSNTDDRGTPEFNKGVFVFTALKGSNAAFFQPVVGKNSYVKLNDTKLAISLGAPGMTTPVQTATPVTIPTGGFGSSITTYGEFVVNVDSADGIHAFDVVTIDTPELTGINFTVSLVVSTSIKLTFTPTGKYIAGVVIPARVRVNVTSSSVSTLTSAALTIPSTGAGSTIAYGNIPMTLTAVPTGLKIGDRVVIENDFTRGVQFTVFSMAGTMITLTFNTTLNPNLGGVIIPQGTSVNSHLFKKEFTDDLLFSWYQDVDQNKWTEIQFSNDIVKDAFLSFCVDDGTMKDPYENYGLFRTIPLSPATGAQYSTGDCKSGCSEYLLYNCYNSDNQSCDTANYPLALSDNLSCGRTWKACTPDNNTLLTTFSPKISNLDAISITRMDSPPGYSGPSHLFGNYNKTDITLTKWSTIYVPQTHKDSSGVLYSNTIPTDLTTRGYFPPWTVQRIVAESYLTIATSLAVSPTQGCPPGYAKKTLNTTEYCEICPAGTYSGGGSQKAPCPACPQGTYCPLGSATNTRQCEPGFYCDTPASQIACPLGFYCPIGSVLPTSCDTSNLVDGAIQTTITSIIPATTAPTTSVSFSVPANVSFVKAAVVGLLGIIGPLKYVGIDPTNNTLRNFSIVTPQFWPNAIPSGTQLTVQTRAHYCPLQSVAPQRCASGKVCPTSMQQLFCPAGKYCNDGSTPTPYGVFEGTQCPAGTYYAPPDVTNANILALQQANTDGSHCYTCPSGSTVSANQDTCICSDTSLTFSIYTGTCIKKCPAGQSPETDGVTCTPCATGFYTNVEGLPKCIRCADNFSSVGTDANGNQVSSGAVKCKCSTTRAGGGTLTNGTTTWDATFNRCKVSCNGGYSAYWSDCVSNTVPARWTATTYTCPGSSTGYISGDPVCLTCIDGSTVVNQPSWQSLGLTYGPVVCRKAAVTVTVQTGTQFGIPTFGTAKQCQNSFGQATGGYDLIGSDCYTPVGKSCGTCFKQVGDTCVFDYTNTTSSCYDCPLSSLYYAGTTTQIYSTTVVGNQCPIYGRGVLNTNPPSPWGNDGDFDGNPIDGMTYLLSILSASTTTFNNRTTRDGSVVKCPSGKVCKNVTLSTGPSIGTSISAGADCPARYYCTADRDVPIPCPAGSYCPTGSALPTACTTGAYCPEGSSSSVQCPAGFYCPTPLDRTPCLPGYYSASTGATDVSTCLLCTAGTYCPSGSASATPCPAGTFCPAVSGLWSNCAAGYYCPSTTTQIPCPAGVTCPIRTSTDYGIVCDRKTVPSTNYQSCTACPNPAMYYVWDAASASSPSVVQFPLATTVTGGYEPVRFRNLTVNNFSFIPGKSIIATSGSSKITGTISSFTNNELVVNINGKSVTGTSSSAAWTITPYGCDTVVRCPGHMKNSTDFMRCEGCPLPAAGYIWAGSSGCETVQCTDGMFPNSDLTTCTRTIPAVCMTNTQCTAGQMCGSNGRCTACAPGTVCASCGTSTPFWDGVACTVCPNGQYWNGTACTACTICADGSYETTACTTTTNRACSTCANPSATQYVKTACTASANTQFETKQTCSSGQFLYGFVAGAYNSSGSPGTCTACSSPSGAQYVTSVCTTSNDTQFGTRSCPANQYYSGGFDAGSYDRIGSAGVCATRGTNTCPAGYTPMTDNITCCTDGNYLLTLGSGSTPGNCSGGTCPYGFKYVPNTTINQCMYSSAPTNARSRFTTSPCYPGDYANGNLCLPCSAGQTSTGDQTCTNCPAGQSSNPPNGVYTCTNCLAGQSSASGGLCTACTGGTTSVAGGLCCPVGQTSVAGGPCQTPPTPATYTKLSTTITSYFGYDTLVIGSSTFTNGTLDTCKTTCNSTSLCKGFSRSSVSADTDSSGYCSWLSVIQSTRINNTNYNTYIKQ